MRQLFSLSIIGLTVAVGAMLSSTVSYAGHGKEGVNREVYLQHRLPGISQPVTPIKRNDYLHWIYQTNLSLPLTETVERLAEISPRLESFLDNYVPSISYVSHWGDYFAENEVLFTSECDFAGNENYFYLEIPTEVGRDYGKYSDLSSMRVCVDVNLLVQDQITRGEFDAFAVEELLHRAGYRHPVSEVEKRNESIIALTTGSALMLDRWYNGQNMKTGETFGEIWDDVFSQIRSASQDVVHGQVVRTTSGSALTGNTADPTLGAAWTDEKGLTWGSVVPKRIFDAQRDGGEKSQYEVYRDFCESIGARLPTERDVKNLRAQLGASLFNLDNRFVERSVWMKVTEFADYRPEVLSDLEALHWLDGGQKVFDGSTGVIWDLDEVRDGYYARHREPQIVARCVSSNL